MSHGCLFKQFDENMEESLIEQVETMRAQFAEVAPKDPSVINQFAWIISKVVNKQHESLGSVRCRQLLADYVKLDVERPSLLHSQILYAAIKVASAYADFHLVPFLKLWDLRNFRPEDCERQPNPKGRTFASLKERVAKAYMQSLLVRPDEVLPAEQIACLQSELNSNGYFVAKMVVSRIAEKDVRGRKLRFATLTSADGMQSSTEVHVLRANPLNQGNARGNYVVVGQVYDVLLRKREDSVAIGDAVLATQNVSDLFECETGYVEFVDEKQGMIHVYDSKSRHYVSQGQRINVQEGQFVRFLPFIPEKSKFKTAIIGNVCSDSEGIATFGMRDVRITQINREKGFCSWELLDMSKPIVEDGVAEPSYVRGFIGKAFLDKHHLPYPAIGANARILVFLKRGKDKVKRPHVVRVANAD